MGCCLIVASTSKSQPNHINPASSPSTIYICTLPLSLPLAVARVVTSCSLISHSWTCIFTPPISLPANRNPPRPPLCQILLPKIHPVLFPETKQNVNSSEISISNFSISSICHFPAYSALFRRSLFLGSGSSVLPTYQSRTLTKAGTRRHSTAGPGPTVVHCH